MHIFVGSTNPVKINSVTIAASEQWSSVAVKGIDVPSGIREQPMSDSETKKGAQNRAKAALEDGILLLEKSGSFSKSDEILGVGLEGGVFTNDENELWSTVWVAVTDRQGNLFEANGARFKVPDRIAQPILAGAEMGPVVSSFFGGKDVRRTNGAIGVITRNFIDRTEEYSGIVKMALGLWFGRDWERDIISKN